MWQVNDRVRATKDISVKDEVIPPNPDTIYENTDGFVTWVFDNGNIIVHFSYFSSDVVLTPEQQKSLVKI